MMIFGRPAETLVEEHNYDPDEANKTQVHAAIPATTQSPAMNSDRFRAVVVLVS